MLQQANDPISRLYALADMIEYGWNGLGFNMANWGVEAECGTTACIAGHAVAAWAPEVWEHHLERVRANRGAASSSQPLAETAMALLRLNPIERNRLFCGSHHTRTTAANRLREIAREKEAVLCSVS